MKLTRDQLIDHVIETIDDDLSFGMVEDIRNNNREAVEEIYSKVLICVKALRKFTEEMSDFSETIADEVMVRIKNTLG